MATTEIYALSQMQSAELLQGVPGSFFRRWKHLRFANADSRMTRSTLTCPNPVREIAVAKFAAGHLEQNQNARLQSGGLHTVMHGRSGRLARLLDGGQEPITRTASGSPT